MGPGARWALFGPIEVADMQGLDIINFINDYLLKELSDADKSPDFLRDKVAAGELGIKAGKGFYEYSEEKIKQLFEGRDRKLLEIFNLQKDFR